MSILYLPDELIRYISDIGKLSTTFSKINKECRSLFLEEIQLKKREYYMNIVLDQILIKSKEKLFKTSRFGSFEFYFLHNINNIQEYKAFRRWWVNKYPKLGNDVFKSNLEYVMGYYDQGDDKIISYKEYYNLKFL